MKGDLPMAKILVIYYSRTGNTKKMAELIAEGIIRESVSVDVRDVKDVRPADLTGYEGILIGSPTYYGSMAAEVKKLLDDSVQYHGKLDGKVGAAFSSSANIAGGNETTILDILNAMLIHGMIIKGDFRGDHYGPVSIGVPDERASRLCVAHGVNTAKLVKKVWG
jgi:NAD(P)H dehydrogenase (quinone)